MADVSALGGTILVISGFWAAANIVIGNAKLTNERRDAMILGKIGSEFINTQHRWLIVYNDWFPMSAANIAAALLFGFFLVFIAKFDILQSDVHRNLCYIFSIVPFVGAIILLLSAISEYKYMRQSIIEGDCKLRQ